MKKHQYNIFNMNNFTQIVCKPLIIKCFSYVYVDVILIKITSYFHRNMVNNIEIDEFLGDDFIIEHQNCDINKIFVKYKKYPKNLPVVDRFHTCDIKTADNCHFKILFSVLMYKFVDCIKMVGNLPCKCL